ncbi:hypothetical protein, partial [Nocardia sp. NPDC050789]|uniref:hypothetical protein n=1 Tax=Nocardia sp. NPDC050789 TaxID=3154841 RepID=UPI0033DFBC8A
LDERLAGMTMFGRHLLETGQLRQLVITLARPSFPRERRRPVRGFPGGPSRIQVRAAVIARAIHRA